MFVAHAGGLVIPNLVAHWTFDEGTGTTVADATGNGHTGTATGSPTWETGWSGSCMNFDGTDDFVTVADHASLNFGADQDFTISLRVKTSTAAVTDIWPIMLGKGASAPMYQFFLSEAAETDRWAFDLRTAATRFYAPAGSTVRDGNWHHLVAQREATTLRTYQNNSQVYTLTDAGISDSVSNASAFIIGKQDADGFEFFFTGSLDDIRFYRRALTTTEIAAIYNGNVA